jgi:hypothetical protein
MRARRVSDRKFAEGREKEHGIKTKMEEKLVRQRRIDHSLDINEEENRFQS